MHNENTPKKLHLPPSFTVSICSENVAFGMQKLDTSKLLLQDTALDPPSVQTDSKAPINFSDTAADF